MCILSFYFLSDSSSTVNTEVCMLSGGHWEVNKGVQILKGRSGGGGLLKKIRDAPSEGLLLFCIENLFQVYEGYDL